MASGRWPPNSSLDAGHDVVVHARSRRRADDALRATPGAREAVVGDLSSIAQTRSVAEQANASRTVRRRDPQRWRRLPRAADRDRRRPRARVRDQCARAVPAHRADRSAGSARVPELGDAPWRRPGPLRPAVGAPALERRPGLFGLQAVRPGARVRGRPALAGRAVERGRAGLGRDQDGRPGRPRRPRARLGHPSVARHQRRPRRHRHRPLLLPPSRASVASGRGERQGPGRAARSV